jgi:uncharacterized membrane protein YgcG
LRKSSQKKCNGNEIGCNSSRAIKVLHDVLFQPLATSLLRCVKKCQIFTAYFDLLFFIIRFVGFVTGTNETFINDVMHFWRNSMSKSGGNSNGGKGQGNGGGWPSGTGNPSGGGRSNAPRK